MLALQGVRVLDMTRVLAGPYCAMMLGDLGADVIKVERPGQGDDSRSWGPPFVGEPYGPYPGESAYFMAANRNKRSITINLKSDEGQAIVRRLATVSDIFMENYRAGTMDRLGFGYEDLRALNPRLVYCSISGYGRTGPDSNTPGYDFVVQAEGGLMGITGPEDGTPYRLGIPIVDIAAGMFASTAILAALRARDQSGEGQYLEVSLLETVAALLTNVASNHLVGGAGPRRYGNAHPNVAPYEAYRARDRWFVLAAGNDRQWAILCDMLDRPDLKQDARFTTNSGRVACQQELRHALAPVFVLRDAGEWLVALKSAGIPCGPINTVPDVFKHRQSEARDLVLESEHPTAGQVRFPGFPYTLTETPASVRRPPPMLGQHSEEVLVDLLGYSTAEVDELRQRHVI